MQERKGWVWVLSMSLVGTNSWAFFQCYAVALEKCISQLSVLSSISNLVSMMDTAAFFFFFFWNILLFTFLSQNT